MSNRKILYGYQIQRGDLVTVPQEAETVQRITALYLDGLSYQKISDTLNGDGIPFSGESPLWNKHKVKRLLEHPDKPEDVVALVLQGVSSRYDCCSVPTEYDTPHRLTEVDFKHFGRAVSHIVIAEDSSVTIQFK